METRIAGTNKRFKHGMTRTRTHNIWSGMLQRCNDKNHKDFKSYGAIGITVCEDWTVFTTFLADMGVCPNKMTLERIDNSKGYCPSNCKWATSKEQAGNRKNNHRITIDGVTLLISEWAQRLGCGDTVIPHRLKTGWSERDACFKPVRKKNANKN